MYLTQEKVAVFGAAGAIGSNLVQVLLATRTTPNISMYDPYEPGLEGAAEEIYHCAFPEANVTWTTDPAEALKGASYVVSSGGAPRKEGMTREDLIRGNSQIARELGQLIARHCPAAKLVIIIFNPADITGLVTLVHSGLAPSRVTTLAALDSTRLQTRLAQHFRIQQDKVTGCRTYGGHGEQMAVFRGGIKIDGVPLDDILAGKQTVNGIGMTQQQWEEIREHVRKGGARIIKLRGRSSFQSPSQLSVEMLRAAMGGEPFPWPCGVYVNTDRYRHVMMAMDTSVGPDGVTYRVPQGTAEDQAALDASYEHLCKLRDSVIADGILPPVEEWSKINPNLA